VVQLAPFTTTLHTLATSGNPGDVSSSLGELERKLRELEQELARVGHPAATPVEPLVPPPPTPIAPAPVTPPSGLHAAPPLAPEPVAAPPAPTPDGAIDRTATDARLTALEEQLDALRSYGAELQDSASRLLDAYRSALTEAERPAAAAVTPPTAVPVAPAPIAVPAVPPVPAAPEGTPVSAPIHDERAQDEIMARFVAAQAAAAAASPTAGPEAPLPPAAIAPPPVAPTMPAPAPGIPAGQPPAQPAPAAVAPDAVGAVEQRYVGAVTVDAGPFADIASLSAFEQGIARVPGVRDVYVRGFQGQRAVIDVDFGTPTALVPELAAVTTVPFIVERADATGLVVTIPTVSPDAS